MRNAFAIAAVLLTLSPQAGSAIEQGFGLSDGAQGSRPRGASEAWQTRVARARMDYEAFAARAVQNYLVRAPAPRERRVGQSASSIMQDPTLRAGDIYAASDGFVVFRGRPAPSHSPTDFAPMPQTLARDLSLAIDMPMASAAKR